MSIHAGSLFEFQMLLQIFRKKAKEAIDIADKKRAEKEAAERRKQEAFNKKKQEEGKGDDAEITELTEEEAAKLERELKEKK